MKSPKRSKPLGAKGVTEGDLTRAPKFPRTLPSPNADHVAPHGWLSGGDRPAPGKTAKTKSAKRGR
jgi:hypothetical protein